MKLRPKEKTVGATKQVMLEKAERENRFQSEDWMKYLEEKTWKRMKKLAGKFSVNEITWIADYVKKLVIAEETHPDYDPIRYANTISGKEGMICSNCHAGEETLVALKVRYGRFLDSDYNPNDIEPFMDDNFCGMYESVKDELETPLN